MDKSEERFSRDHLVLSSSYSDTMDTVVLPYLEGLGQDLTVPGAGQKPLFCSRFTADDPKGTVLVVHGFTGNACKFSELIFSLLQNGFSVVAYDQRGHGRSWRNDRIRDISLTDVDDFGDYVADLEIIVDTVLTQMPAPWMILAHSMGGAVASLYMEKHPGVMSRAVLCSPMIEPNVKMPAAAAKLMCTVMKLAGKGKSRLFASRPYSEKECFETSCASGRERFEWYEDMRQKHSEFRNNGPTYDWVLESINVTGRILAPGGPEKVACPVRLYSAENETMVIQEAQKKFIDRVKQGTMSTVAGAKHEIFRSGDDVMFPWWRDVLVFLASGT